MNTYEGNEELLHSPAVLQPSKSELHAISNDLKLKCTSDEIDGFHEYIKSTLKVYQRVNKMAEPQLPVKYARTPGYRDTTDPSWYWRCDIQGASSGALVGKTIGVKDNIAVAGIPMMNGNKQLEGYTPEYDASVVTRMLDAGARIVGKTTCDDLCLAGSSWTASTGPVPHPLFSHLSSGGSSSGSASLVARGKIDMAVGADQAGSIRIPASWCGIVGLKPTFGLVPYTGAVCIEATLDHIGPLTKTVADCALLLEVLAGYDDGTDPRQHPAISSPDLGHLEGVSGMRVGLLQEGFHDVDKDVEKCVLEAAQSLTAAGITVEYVSVPMHTDGAAIWAPIDFEGAYNMMMKGNGFGMNWKGHYCTSTQEALTKGVNLRPHDFSMPCKMLAVFGEYMSRNYQNKFYSKCQNLNRLLTKAYDEALTKYDVLVMPTVPTTATRLPRKDDSVAETLKLTFGMIQNTAPFNATGHPAITVNAGWSDGLPVGMMVVGRHFHDKTILRIGHAFENIRDESSIDMQNSIW